MKQKTALDAMEHIAPEWIDEAETYTKKKNAWLKWGAVAACLCLVIGAVILLPGRGSEKPAVRLGDPTLAGQGSESEKPIMPVGSDEMPIMPGGVNSFAEIPAPEREEEAEYERGDVRMLIGHYDRSLNAVGDLAVYGGGVELSGSLEAALEALGNTVNYRVVVEVFQDGAVLWSGSEEVAAEEARLANEYGYTVAHESYQVIMEREDYFTLHATAEQLRSFPASAQYGYYLALYDEYLGLAEPMTEPVFNQPFERAEVPEAPDEVAALWQKLAEAMAAGELPYVCDILFSEDGQRVEVFAQTNDQALLDRLRSTYDPTGEYLTVVPPPTD